MIAVDTNVMVYAHRAETEFHDAALDRLTALCEGNSPFALPIPCLSEFLRVTTHPKVFNPPSRLRQALEFAKAVTEAPSCRLLRPADHFVEHLFSVMEDADARGNLVFDAQIVALCREHGVSNILTNDRDFERFAGISVSYIQAA